VLDGVGPADDAVVDQQELPGGQPGHGPALAVTDDGPDGHQVDAAPEDGLAFLGSRSQVIRRPEDPLESGPQDARCKSIRRSKQHRDGETCLTPMTS
jgi:hypothetical protein